jgi:hypothetical protein
MVANGPALRPVAVFYFVAGVNFLISSQSGDHPHEDLAKFGNMKVKNLKHPFIFLATYFGTVYTNLEIFVKFWLLKISKST